MAGSLCTCRSERRVAIPPVLRRADCLVRAIFEVVRRKQEVGVTSCIRAMGDVIRNFRDHVIVWETKSRTLSDVAEGGESHGMNRNRSCLLAFRFRISDPEGTGDLGPGHPIT
jgi:hypothetical protein